MLTKISKRTIRRRVQRGLRARFQATAENMRKSILSSNSYTHTETCSSDEEAYESTRETIAMSSSEGESRRKQPKRSAKNPYEKEGVWTFPVLSSSSKSDTNHSDSSATMNLDGSPHAEYERNQSSPGPAGPSTQP
nr:unnamed protein product [Spirometra erinaceieuropaei]